MTVVSKWLLYSMLPVLYGEPITLEQLQNNLPNFEAAALAHHAATLGILPLDLYEDPTDEEMYWDDMIDEDRAYEVYVAPPPNPFEGVIGHPLSQNRRVCAPQHPTIIVIDDDDEASYTGSSDGFHDMENMIALPPPDEEVPVSNVDEINGKAALTGWT